MRIFSKQATNLGRQTEMDLLRGFTALDIIICHVGLYLGNRIGNGLYIFCDICGSEFAAPILMILMGISVVYSKHQAPSDLMKRGICLFLAGYALNFFRSILPLWILGNVDEWTSLEAFFVVDILPFAGLTFLFLALLKKMKVPDIGILAISMIMVIVNQFLMLPESVSWNSELLTGIVNLFCPVTSWSCFPFLTWFFFPAFGLVFGDLLVRCSDKKKLYTILLPAGLLGVLYVYLQFYFRYPDYTSYYYGHNFYYMGLKNVLLTVFFLCFALAFWFFAGKILPSAGKKFLSFLSKNLNLFYIISWIIISLLMHLQAIFGWNFNTAATLGIMVLMIVACAVFTQLWILAKRKIRQKRNSAKQPEKQA